MVKTELKATVNSYSPSTQPTRKSYLILFSFLWRNTMQRLKKLMNQFSAYPPKLKVTDFHSYNTKGL